jgi:hypothetical protein
MADSLVADIVSAAASKFALHDERAEDARATIAGGKIRRIRQD